MKAASIFASAVLLACSCTLAHGASEPANWTSFNSAQAVAEMDGITITATVTPGQSIAGIFNNRLDGQFWEADYPAPAGTEAIGVNGVGPGQTQTFTFSDGLASVLVYVENYDGSLSSTVTAVGATSMNFITGSDLPAGAVTYSMNDATSGVLSSSNASFNGQGEAILEITGPLESLTFQYTGGAANAVFYGFIGMAEGDGGTDPPNPVPEPASILVWSALLGLGVIMARRRRRK